MLKLIVNPILWMQRHITFDALCLCSLSVLSFWFSLHLSASIPCVYYEKWDFWFDADINRVLQNIDASDNETSRNHTHPLFAAFFKPLSYKISLLQTGHIMFGRELIGTSGTISTAAVFLTLRALKVSPFSRLLGTCMFICSGAFIFWWSVLETFPIGGAFIAVLILALSIGLKSKLFWILATPLTMGMTLTNWFICIIGVFQSFRWKKSFELLALGILTSAASYGVSTQILRTNTRGMPDLINEEQQFLIHPENLDALPEYAEIYIKRGVGFFCSPAVAAQGYLGTAHYHSDKYVGIWYGGFRYSFHGYIAVLCWLILFFKGAFNLFRYRKKSKVTFMIFAFLLFQLALHLVYGRHPFLYCAHWASSLIIIASFSMNGSRARLFQFIALTFCVFAMLSNLETFYHSIELVLEANR